MNHDCAKEVRKAMEEAALWLDGEADEADADAKSASDLRLFGAAERASEKAKTLRAAAFGVRWMAQAPNDRVSA